MLSGCGRSRTEDWQGARQLERQVAPPASPAAARRPGCPPSTGAVCIVPWTGALTIPRGGGGGCWVITAHDEAIPVLEEFADRVSGSGDTGTLDGPSFLAALLEWVLGSYSAAFERMEEQLEEFDVQAMRGDGSDDDIDVLTSMRRQVGKLRRALAAHRSALVALTHPELVLLGNNRSGERFESLFSRYEATLQEARDAREVIVGSFDVLIARGGHHTNEIMKVLTLTSVILLPGALLAGIMGMNFQVGSSTMSRCSGSCSPRWWPSLPSPLELPSSQGWI